MSAERKGWTMFKSGIQGRAVEGADSGSASTGDYIVGPHIYSAAVDGEGILLDLVGDRYWAMSELSAHIWFGGEKGMSRERLVESMVCGWDFDSQVAEEIIDRQVGVWEDECFITRGALGSDLNAKVLPKPRDRRKATKDVALRTKAIPSVLIGGTILVVWLDLVCRVVFRFGMLPFALWAMQRIRVLPSPRSRRNAVMGSLLSAYRRVRAPVVQGSDDCLYRTVALAAVLRLHNVDAEVCVGVSKFPFLAHAWVQVGDCVVNQEMEDIADYVVIAQF